MINHLFAGLFAVLLSSCGNPCTSESKLVDLAKNEVLAHLKAPATAQFSDSKVTLTRASGYLVDGTVDSQNAFGALLRTSFTVCIRCDDGKPYVPLAMAGDYVWGTEHDEIVEMLNDRSDEMIEEVSARERHELERMRVE